MGYKSITLYSDTKVDYLLAIKHEADAGEIATVDDSAFEPAWDSFTDVEIVVPFTDSLISSYISGLTSPVVSYIVYRQKTGESKLVKVAEVSETVNKIRDYGVEDNTEYKWYVFPATENEFGVSLVSPLLTTCWGSWSIIELIPISSNIYNAGEIWIFGSNLQANDVEQKLDRTIFQTYAQYPKSSVGRTNYKTLGFTSLISNISSTSSTYTDTVDLKREWDAFVAKGHIVLLKDRKGHVYYGQLNNASANIDNSAGSLPTTITVSFTELQDFKDISVYSEV